VTAVVCVGRLKERYLADAVTYYQSGRPKNDPVRIVEVPDESAPEGLSPAQRRKITEKEGEALLRQIGAAAGGGLPVVVALDISGKKYAKAEIGAIMRDAEARGRGVAFVIGGSLGLGENVLERADFRWSLSAMTLPHQLARVVCLAMIGM